MRNRMNKTYYLAAFLVGFFLTLQVQGFLYQTKYNAQAEVVGRFLINPAPVISKTSIQTGAGKPTVKEVQDYLKVIFGPKWRVAWAVAEAECNHTRKEWPMCSFGWAKELSIGMFQINIAKEEGRGAWVHWQKIPGDNLQEKQAYLMDWKNNVLMAFVVSWGGTNWNPWTGYISQAYKKHL